MYTICFSNPTWVSYKFDSSLFYCHFNIHSDFWFWFGFFRCKTFAEVPEGCSPQPVDECCSELVCTTTNSTDVNAVVSAVSVHTQTQTTELTNQDLENIPHRRIGGSNLIKPEMFEGTRASGLMTSKKMTSKGMFWNLVNNVCCNWLKILYPKYFCIVSFSSAQVTAQLLSFVSLMVNDFSSL